MIYYFSGTGNSKYVAQRLAEATGEQAISIAETLPNDNHDETLGLVMPVYYWGIPNLMLQFLEGFKVSQSYVYIVLTAGGSTGNAAKMCEKAMQHKADAIFSVIMPDTYTPMFDVSDKIKNEKILDAAEPEIDAIIQKVKQKAQGDFNHHKGPRLFTPLVYPMYGRLSTADFKVNLKCIGCGECARNCPVGNIEMKGDRPVWKEKKCVFCLQCLHRCPKFAITFKNSEKNGQYYNPRVK